MQRAARKLKETEFLTKAILAYGRWMMGTLPDSAILITNGDMDTFPILALQAAEGFRSDVVIAEKQWLGLKQYLSYMSDYYTVPIPLKKSQIDSLFKSRDFPQNMLLVADLVFKGWLEQKADGSLSRPVAIAVTVEEDFYADFKDYLQYSGPFLVWKPNPVNDIPDTFAFRNSIDNIQIEDFSGQWVSERDCSPVRTIYTKELVRNITLMALAYSESLIRAKQYAKADGILNWVETFEKKTELGPVYSERISELKDLTRHEKQ
jgi:hypothetical protein